MIIEYYIFPVVSSVCICASIFFINKKCVEHTTAEHNKYVILTEETYNNIVNNNQPKYQDYQTDNKDKDVLPPNYES